MTIAIISKTDKTTSELKRWFSSPITEFNPKMAGRMFQLFNASESDVDTLRMELVDVLKLQEGEDFSIVMV